MAELNRHPVGDHECSKATLQTNMLLYTYYERAPPYAYAYDPGNESIRQEVPDKGCIECGLVVQKGQHRSQVVYNQAWLVVCCCAEQLHGCLAHMPAQAIKTIINDNNNIFGVPAEARYLLSASYPSAERQHVLTM